MHKRGFSRPILPLLLGVAAVAAVLLFAVRFHGSGGADTENTIESTLRLLEAMESRDVAQAEAAVRGLSSGGAAAEALADTQSTDGSPDEYAGEGLDETDGGETGTDGSSAGGKDEASIKASILAGNVLDNVTIRQKFAGTAIIGDSITESIWEYGFLDQDVVISQRGLSVIAADEQIATAIALYPKVVFMSFGANDLESYVSDVDGFIAGYRTQVNKLKEALPGVPIYINSIAPIAESAIAEIPALGYYPQYNEALRAMCGELGCTYLDTSFIIENDPGLLEPDGEHVVASYYPQWLTYMAEMAGL